MPPFQEKKNPQRPFLKPPHAPHANFGGPFTYAVWFDQRDITGPRARLIGMAAQGHWSIPLIQLVGIVPSGI